MISLTEDEILRLCDHVETFASCDETEYEEFSKKE